jgi:hypothetical protein
VTPCSLRLYVEQQTANLYTRAVPTLHQTPTIHSFSALLEPLSIALAFILAYLWTTSPTLREYSLQLAAGLFLIYFLTKRLQQTKWNHIMPSEESVETALLVGAVAIVVGSTAGLGSPFLPLFYLLLFVSVMTISLTSNLVEMVSLLVFLWAISTQPLTTNYWLELLSLPLLLPLMLFARWQFEEAQEDRYRLAQEENLLQRQESHMLMFISTHLLPKLRELQGMLVISEHNRLSVAKQLEILSAESTRVMQDIDHADDAKTIAEQAIEMASQDQAVSSPE